MKSKITLFFAALLMSFASMAQTPNMINYQGVARDSMGNPYANQQIKLRLKIHNGTSTGPVLYTQSKTVTTTSTGLFTLQINGTGGSVSGIFENINWATDKKYLQVEMDPNGGSNYTKLGTQQLVSVPYALDAQKAEKLVMPYSQTDSMANDMMNIDNKNYTAIHGKSTNYYGIHGQSTNNYGVFGTTASPNYAAVYGQNFTSGTGVNGYSGTGKGVEGNTTTGIGVNGKSTSTGIGVVGESTTWIGVKGITSSTNYASACGVYGEAIGTIGYGVIGIANFSTGVGVSGGSNLGIGVSGSSNSYIGVRGSSVYSTGLQGTSTYGYGLVVSGMVRIDGGNTTPGKGKVLTSDSLGNATWEGAVAFSATVPIGNGAIPPITGSWIDLSSETYDISNNYNTSTKRFSAPVNGIYHFDSQIAWASSPNAFKGEMSIVKIVNGIHTSIANNDLYMNAQSSGHNTVGIDVMLKAGDMVYVSVYQNSNISQTLIGGNSETYFNGRLVVKL